MWLDGNQTFSSVISPHPLSQLLQLYFLNRNPCKIVAGHMMPCSHQTFVSGKLVSGFFSRRVLTVVSTH